MNWQTILINVVLKWLTKSKSVEKVETKLNKQLASADAKLLKVITDAEFQMNALYKKAAVLGDAQVKAKAIRRKLS